MLNCPRCFLEIAPADGVKFCPRCGLADVIKAATDTTPVDIKVDGKTIRVLDRLAVGSMTSVYRCTVSDSSVKQAVFKIARDARCNAAVANEARVLMKLGQSPDGPVFLKFLPHVIASFAHGDVSREPLRRANVLCYHSDVKSPDELYSLQEVRDAFPNGMDAKDVAWIWRRLLNVLSFCHANGVAHTDVLPAHVLIEPMDHKLILIDWCAANTRERWTLDTVVPDSGTFRRWFTRDGVPRKAGPALDVSMGARCMLYLLNGSETPVEFPSTAEPAVLRHLKRCVEIPDDKDPSAGDLLSQFDKLIEVLWGPRQFRPLTLPPRS